MELIIRRLTPEVAEDYFVLPRREKRAISFCATPFG